MRALQRYPARAYLVQGVSVLVNRNTKFPIGNVVVVSRSGTDRSLKIATWTSGEEERLTSSPRVAGTAETTGTITRSVRRVDTTKRPGKVERNG